MLRRFRKIPFACSYLPGKANLKLKLGIGGFLFLLAVDLAAYLELWSLQKPARYFAALGILITATIVASRRTSSLAASPENRIQFEDAPAAHIYALDLRRDSGCVNDGAYLDSVVTVRARSLKSSLGRGSIGILFVIAAGFAYERFGEWRDHQRFPQIGRSVNIGGRSLNIFCSGNGSPAVVMDSGAHQPGYSWSLVQRSAAKLTRSCWYDRAGYGWSDAAPRSRTSADIANDLHHLLYLAKIPPPYVLVGHSFGGFNVRVFAARYPREIAGMVLVDSADEYEDRGPMPRTLQSPAARYVPQSWRPAISTFLEFCVHAGWARLLDSGVAGAREPFSRQQAAMIHALRLQPKAFDASMNEGLARAATLSQVRAVRSLGSTPLIVLSGARMPPFVPDDDAENDLLERYMDFRVHRTQARLATLSTRGQQIVLKTVGHDIPVEAPEVIVEAVRAILCTGRTAGRPAH
jgi:pimeloyl-ACP methyl ester carboxylesterase